MRAGWRPPGDDGEVDFVGTALAVVGSLVAQVLRDLLGGLRKRSPGRQHTRAKTERE